MNNSFIDTARICPCCGAQASHAIVSISAQQIADNNWSYRENYRSLLNLSGDELYDIVKCSECDFIYSKNLPSPEFLGLVYDQVIDLNTEQALAQYKNEHPRRLNYLSILSHLVSDNTSDLKALDFGAGFGQTSKIMQALDIDVVAYETSALRRSSLSELGINTVSTIDQIIKNGPYSVIICDNVLEHVPDPNTVIELFESISHANTIVFISVPSYEKQEVNRSLDMSLNPWEHLNYFDKQHLDIMLAKHNFEVIPADQLGAEINIGLRIESSSIARLKNAAISCLRLLRFVANGTSVDSVNRRFYRLNK
jgi:2-polyprenyl-3-methyl-5-hydroxy-6-metoxy-1,4-benzoquinol methylase/rubredoxin